MPTSKSVLCVSWNPSLAATRQMMLMQAGYVVISSVGRERVAIECHAKADLLVLGYSVPRVDKRTVIKCFRQHSKAPILSLLKHGQKKLPEADFAVETLNSDDFVKAVKAILPANG
jgi:DNA-binding response OmpR family regulator